MPIRVVSEPSRDSLVPRGRRGLVARLQPRQATPVAGPTDPGRGGPTAQNERGTLTGNTLARGGNVTGTPALQPEPPDYRSEGPIKIADGTR